jgi:hypothetical protein
MEPEGSLLCSQRSATDPNTNPGCLGRSDEYVNSVTLCDIRVRGC